MKRFGYALAAGLAMGAAALAQTPPAQVPAAKPPANRPLAWAFPTPEDVVNKSPVPATPGPAQPPAVAERPAAMPKIVRDGAPGGALACSLCHSDNGFGHPESAGLVGLTPEYFVRTMLEFRSGVRNEPERMTAIAKATSDQDIRDAAAWFATVKAEGLPWTKVVETDTVPKTFIGTGRMRFVDPDAKGASEPIGQRIIQVPEDVVRVRARDPAAGFIAYVPRGSLARGKALAEGGGGKTVECAICHGPGLKGLGNVPPIAGVHPLYLVRELYDIQNGSRNGPDAQLMKRVVAKLTDADIIALSAYVGSLKR